MKNGPKKLKSTKSKRFLRRVVQKQNKKIQVALKVIQQENKKIDSARKVIAKVCLTWHESRGYRKWLPQRPIQKTIHNKILATQEVFNNATSVKGINWGKFFSAPRIDPKVAKDNGAELVVSVTGYFDGRGKYCLSEPSRPFYLYKQLTIINPVEGVFIKGYKLTATAVGNPPSELAVDTIYFFYYTTWRPVALFGFRMPMAYRLQDKYLGSRWVLNAEMGPETPDVGYDRLSGRLFWVRAEKPTAEHLLVFDELNIGALVEVCSFP